MRRRERTCYACYAALKEPIRVVVVSYINTTVIRSMLDLFQPIDMYNLRSISKSWQRLLQSGSMRSQPQSKLVIEFWAALDYSVWFLAILTFGLQYLVILGDLKVRYTASLALNSMKQNANSIEQLLSISQTNCVSMPRCM